MTPPPFQRLLDDHGRAVHRFLLARIGPDAADDCWQETWLSALRAYPELRELRNPRAWLLTIAHHEAIDHLRRRGRRATPVAELSELAPAVEDPGMAAVGDGAVWRRVAALPDKQRTAVALRYLGDLSHAEIGAAMGTSEAAARRNVHEAVKRLREVQPR